MLLVELRKLNPERIRSVFYCTTQPFLSCATSRIREFCGINSSYSQHKMRNTLGIFLFSLISAIVKVGCSFSSHKIIVITILFLDLLYNFHFSYYWSLLLSTSFVEKFYIGEGIITLIYFFHGLGSYILSLKMEKTRLMTEEMDTMVFISHLNWQFYFDASRLSYSSLLSTLTRSGN